MDKLQTKILFARIRLMKKTFKTFVFVGLVLLVAIFVAPSFFVSTMASASNFTGDYVCISTKQNSDNNLVWSLDFGLNTTARNLEENEEATYRINLQIMVREILEEYKTMISTIDSQNPQEALKNEGKVEYSVPIYDQQKDKVGFKIIFESTQVYNFYMANDSDRLKNENYLFVINQEKSMLFPFAKIRNSAGGQKTLARYFKEKFISACSGLSIEQVIKSYDPEFIYDYGTTSSRIKSDGEIQYQENGIYHHVWYSKESKISESDMIKLQLVTPNKGWWYVFGTGLPLVAMGVAILIVKLKDRNKKKKTVGEEV